MYIVKLYTCEPTKQIMLAFVMTAKNPRTLSTPNLRFRAVRQLRQRRHTDPPSFLSVSIVGHTKHDHRLTMHRCLPLAGTEAVVVRCCADAKPLVSEL